jgi:hypothetical protein
MKTCIVIPCCGKKLKIASKAKDMYLSILFKKSKSLAENCGCDWFILSAGYGLVHPEQIIQPYNKVFRLSRKMKKQAELPEVLTKEQALQIKKNANLILKMYDRRIYLLNSHYRKDLLPGEAPLSGMGLGYQTQYLTNTSPSDLGF